PMRVDEFSDMPMGMNGSVDRAKLVGIEIMMKAVSAKQSAGYAVLVSHGLVTSTISTAGCSIAGLLPRRQPMPSSSASIKPLVTCESRSLLFFPSLALLAGVLALSP
ncbi:MAG: hypothetical protein AAF225_10545, partial [Pseudomonadota bacterium]